MNNLPRMLAEIAMGFKKTGMAAKIRCHRSFGQVETVLLEHGSAVMSLSCYETVTINMYLGDTL